MREERVGRVGRGERTETEGGIEWREIFAGREIFALGGSPFLPVLLFCEA
jgi:hypothetical protein